MEIVVKLSSVDGVTLKTAGRWCNRNIRVELDEASRAVLIPENLRKGVSALGFVGTLEEGQPPLPAPTIAKKDGSTSTIVITDTSGVADMYLIYVDGVYKGYAESTEVNPYAYTAGMADGDYTVTVIAVDTGAGAVSKVSGEISFTRQTFNLTVTIDYSYGYNDSSDVSGLNPKFTIDEPFESGEVTSINANDGYDEGSYNPYGTATGVNASFVSGIEASMGGEESNQPYIEQFTIEDLSAESFVDFYLDDGGNDVYSASVKNAVNCSGSTYLINQEYEYDYGTPIYRISNLSSDASVTLYYDDYSYDYSEE